jgi:hypothetical protein
MKKYITFCIKNNHKPLILNDSFVIGSSLFSYNSKKTNLNFIDLCTTKPKDVMIQISKEIGYPFLDIFERFDKTWSENELFCYNSFIKKINLIKHYHRSILHSKKKGKPSPFEGINDSEIRERVIINRMIYGRELNINNIMDGLTISFLAPRVSIFSPTLAKQIIHEFCKHEITDPFSGFSGRMIGAQLAQKKYRGSDIRSDVVEESNNIAKHLQYNCQLKSCDFKDSWSEGETMFTCPPYGEKELWSGVPYYKEEDFYIEYLLQNTSFNQYLFVVKNTKYKNNIIKEIKNGSWSGGKDNEKLLLFKKI